MYDKQNNDLTGGRNGGGEKNLPNSNEKSIKYFNKKSRRNKKKRLKKLCFLGGGEFQEIRTFAKFTPKKL